jgi:hypothetical protein
MFDQCSNCLLHRAKGGSVVPVPISIVRASLKCEVVGNRETVRSGVGASRLFATKGVSMASEARHH